MKVIYIRLGKEEKDKLEVKAKSLGLTLTAYCRMVLLQIFAGEKCQK